FLPHHSFGGKPHFAPAWPAVHADLERYSVFRKRLDPEIALQVVLAGFSPILLGEFLRVELSGGSKVRRHLKPDVPTPLEIRDLRRSLRNRQVPDTHFVGQGPY